MEQLQVKEAKNIIAILRKMEKLKIWVVQIQIQGSTVEYVQ